MLISLSNPKGTPVLTCTRDDGTVTYSKSRHGAFFGPHDLMHYCVETTLGLRDSFFGLINRGWTVEAFNEPGAAARLPDEAGHTEHIVNLLLQEQAFGAPASAVEFNVGLAASVASTRGAKPLAVRLLTDDDLSRIREMFARLMGAYRSLAPGASLDLTFP